MKPELTPEAMLLDMALHARSSVVHVEPTTVAEWRECIGHVLCGAAFDVGLAEKLREAVGQMGVEYIEKCVETAELVKALQSLARVYQPQKHRDGCSYLSDVENAGQTWSDALLVLQKHGGPP